MLRIVFDAHRTGEPIAFVGEIEPNGCTIVAELTMHGREVVPLDGLRFGVRVTEGDQRLLDYRRPHPGEEWVETSSPMLDARHVLVLPGRRVTVGAWVSWLGNRFEASQVFDVPKPAKPTAEQVAAYEAETGETVASVTWSQEQGRWIYDAI